MLGLRLDEPLPLAGRRGRRSTPDGLERLAEGGPGGAPEQGSLTLTPRGRLPRRRRDGAAPRLTRRPTMGGSMQILLSDRQRDILRPRRRGVRRDRAAGRLADARRAGRRSASRRRPCARELAELERLGLLTHPHTSAGRVPTEAGYRIYVDELLARPEPRPDEFPLGLPAARAEVEEALQATTEMLSQVTRLLALVSAPPLEAATVRHVEVLLLQPNVVMVVVITSTGGVTEAALTRSPSRSTRAS